MINLLFFRWRIVSLVFILGWSTMAPAKDFAQVIVTAIAQGERTPNVSDLTSLDMSSAYHVQRGVIEKRLRGDPIAGFKAGLTSPAMQARYQTNRPIFGVLFKSGDYSAHKTISLKKFHLLMVETELGFITNQPIKKTVQSIAELKSYIAKVVPVIELPELGFVRQPVNLADLVAANAASCAYIYDDDINWLGQDINNLTVSLFYNGSIVNQGQGQDALGDQWEALRWLVNQIIAQGWMISAGNLLITGALGDTLVAKPGTYKAQFNDGARIEFTFID